LAIEEAWETDMYKTGDEIAVRFYCRKNASLELVDADSMPAAVLLVNGVASAATVTVTKPATGTYLASVTLPTIADGDVLQLCVTATVSAKNQGGTIWYGVGATVRPADITPAPGANNVTITVDDGTDPVPNAAVAIYDGGVLAGQGTTDANGQVTVGLDDGSYTVAIYHAGYTSGAETLTVPDDGDPTYSITLETITPPPSEDTTTVRIYTRIGGVATPGVLVQLKQTAAKSGSTGYGDSDDIREDRSGAAGYVEFVVLRNAAHAWRVGSSGAFHSFTPTTPTYTAMTSQVGHEPNR
jgi:hypothetical protein